MNLARLAFGVFLTFLFYYVLLVTLMTSTLACLFQDRDSFYCRTVHEMDRPGNHLVLLLACAMVSYLLVRT